MIIIFLQHFENLALKHWTKTGEIVYYGRYVDDVLLIFDRDRITEDDI